MYWLVLEKDFCDIIVQELLDCVGVVCLIFYVYFCDKEDFLVVGYESIGILQIWVYEVFGY